MTRIARPTPVASKREVRPDTRDPGSSTRILSPASHMLSRLLPSTLFGRLVLTLVSGVALTMLVTLLIQVPERDALVFRVAAGRAATRLADLIHLLDRLPAQDRGRVAATASERGVQVTLGVAPAELQRMTDGTRPALFRDRLLDELGGPRELAVDIVDVDLPAMGSDADSGRAVAFDLRVPLADGQWVRFEFRERHRLSLWPKRLSYNMLTMLAMVTLLALVVVRWVTQPLGALARAAEQLGRDVNRPPLPETGPQEVRRAARAFNAMQRRLSRYVGSRTALLTALSHDLKTPITRLRLRAELLEQQEMRDKFVRDLTEMEEMVAATLGYLRGLDPGGPLSTIDVRSLLEALQADAEELGHRVDVEAVAIPNVLGKPQGLKRCLQNLLDNALRYGRDVEIVADSAADELRICVRDRGPGIPDADLERVFEPFVRLESSRNLGTGGTGLGLAIARDIAHSMGGDVTLRNRPAGGLEATVRLPRAPPRAEPALEA